MSFIRDFLRRYRETGEIGAKPQGGDRRAKIKGIDQEVLKKIITERSDMYLREVQEALQQRTGIDVSVSSLCRTPKYRTKNVEHLRNHPFSAPN